MVLRARRGLQQPQRQFERQRLRGDVVRLAGGIAEREIREQEARHGGVLDDVLGAAHHHGRNAVGFEMPRHQRRGLVADRAVRHEHGDVDLVGEAARREFRARRCRG